MPLLFYYIFFFYFFFYFCSPSFVCSNLNKCNWRLTRKLNSYLASRLNLYFNIGVCVCVLYINCKILERIKLLLLLLPLPIISTLFMGWER